MDTQISKEEYDEIITGLQAERHNVEVRLQRLTEAADSFNKSLSTIFLLASKAHDLFKSSELEEKRRITILFPNLEMSAEKLVFKPRKPFDVFLNLPHRPNWLPLVTSFPEKIVPRFFPAVQYSGIAIFHAVASSLR